MQQGNRYRNGYGERLYNFLSQFQNVPFWPISALGSNFNPRNTTSYLKIKILGQNQGGFDFQTADILKYFEDLEIESNAEFGPKDYFEMACTCIPGVKIFARLDIDQTETF